MSFVHLHNHTDYSFLDGASKVKDLVKEAKRLGMPGIAITDHGNMCGAVDFYNAAIKEGIKPIIGCELYMTAGSRFEKSVDAYGKQPKRYHQILIAKNEIGWKNLSKLSSIGYIEGFYTKPRIDYDALHDHREGLICLSGCPQSHLNQTVLSGEEKEAMHIAGKLQDLFGEDFYLELQQHHLDIEVPIISSAMKFAKQINAKLVATNDTHYLKAEHWDPHDCLLCVQTRADRNDPNRMRFDGREYYLKTEQEMRELFKEVPQACDNTNEVLEKVEFEMNFNEKHFPEFTLPIDTTAKTDFEYLQQLCEEGLPSRYDEDTPEIRERLELELSIIQMKHLASYFLIVRDFIQFARDNDIPVGPGRGSAAGSLVSYLIGITNIDPLRYGLLFERFINPERESYPDIDVDFADTRRGEVIEYVRKKYGEDCVSQIITFGRMLSKQVIKDVGRVMGVPLPDVESITKLIPDPQQGRTAKLADAMQDKELSELINSRMDFRELMDKALVLEGTIRNAGVHAAGVVITPEPIGNFVPLMVTKDKNVVTQFDMGHVETLGLLKVDFLGLKTLSILEHTISLIEKRGIKIVLDEIPVDDKATFELFGQGSTVGIFQFESGGMRENLRKLKPERLEDLIAMNALYRPGPMSNIDDFIARKHGKQKITYLHPMLGNILDETYGIIVYQEQVMQIANQLAGMSLGRADELRRAMGKKKQALMDQMKPEFVEGCGKNGLDAKKATELWDLIDKFASYGFNKSHAAGYALVAYQTGYLKTHYPAEFMAASMTTRKDNTDELVLFLEECRKMNIKVVAPDVNVCDVDFTVNEEGEVLFGLSAIKGVGTSAILNILGERDTAGNFEDIYDLAGRVDGRLVNKRVLENLVYAGATDALTGHRAQQLHVLEQAIAYGQQMQRERANGQVSIFGGGEDDSSSLPRPELPPVPEMKGRDKLREERERLGFYFSGHPLLRFRREVESISSMSTADLSEGTDGMSVRIAGLLNSVERRPTRTGNIMGRARLEDLSGFVPVIMFPKTYEKLKDKIEEDAPALLMGRLQVRDQQVEIIVEEIEPLENAVRRMIRGVQIIVSDSVRGQEVLGLEEEFRKFPGNAKVKFVFRNADGETWRLASTRFSVNPVREFLDKAEELLGADAVRLDVAG
ncbi:DNA polymerase III subunit alpha [bacterium]|nr:DNA polymerase III subunit alpha [bacterium]